MTWAIAPGAGNRWGDLLASPGRRRAATPSLAAIPISNSGYQMWAEPDGAPLAAEIHERRVLRE